MIIAALDETILTPHSNDNSLARWSRRPQRFLEDRGCRHFIN
ncbi:hypothetical protein [Mycobacterium sp. IS-1590]|nr:hypothetical protein [Mycobacterium sp. IS-1590]